MGNVTVTNIERRVVGNQREVAADFTLSATYVAGGDTITAASIIALFPGGQALTEIKDVDFDNPVAGQAFALDKTNKKILAFDGTSELGNGDYHLVTARGRFRLAPPTGQ